LRTYARNDVAEVALCVKVHLQTHDHTSTDREEVIMIQQFDCVTLGDSLLL
jgi:hypothetical protein